MIVVFVIALVLAGIVGGAVLCECFMVDGCLETIAVFALGFVAFDALAVSIWALIIILMGKL